MLQNRPTFQIAAGEIHLKYLMRFGRGVSLVISV